jgi:hypothetical protein
MIINGALLLLVRSVSMALLAMIGGKWVLVYLASDMGLYFVYKLLRQDLWHWLPVDGGWGVFASVAERAIVKVLVDFTGVMQFRAAGEMGGTAFSCNLALALVTPAVATHVFFQNDGAGAGDSSYVSAGVDSDSTAIESKLDPADVWTIVGGLSSLWLVCFAAFLLLMKRR